MTFVARDPGIHRWPELSTPDWYERLKGVEQGPITPLKVEGTVGKTIVGPATIEEQGIKDNKDKLFYELDFRFIQAMAQRMADNKKDKYPRWNWKKSMNIEELKQATLRHLIEVMECNYDDEGKSLDHIVAVATNTMMLWHRLKVERQQEKGKQLIQDALTTPRT